MWKLTISQKKKVTYESEGETKSFESENKVEFESNVLDDLLALLSDAERLYPDDTKYVIERVDE